MKLNFRLLAVFTAMLIFLSASGCYAKKDYGYLKKDTLTLQDVERLFKDNGIKLTDKGKAGTQFDILQNKHSNMYYIGNDKKKQLQVYVFTSEGERTKAKSEYNDKTALMIMTYQEIYEEKNIMVILNAGDSADKYYSKIRSAMEKIKTQ